MIGLFRRNKHIEQGLINLGCKTTKNEDSEEITFETEVLNGFKLVGIIKHYNDSWPEFVIVRYRQEKDSNDFKACGFIDGCFFHNIKKILPKLKSLIDNFNKYCGNSAKPVSEYSYAELNDLYEEFPGRKYRSRIWEESYSLKKLDESK
jgi:hypothetical protein